MVHLRHVIDRRQVVARVYLSKLLLANVFTLVFVSIDRTHNVPDFEAHTAYLDQVSSAQLVAREIHLRWKRLLDDLPDFLFGLFL